MNKQQRHRLTVWVPDGMGGFEDRVYEGEFDPTHPRFQEGWLIWEFEGHKLAFQQGYLLAYKLDHID